MFLSGWKNKNQGQWERDMLREYLDLKALTA
jgi:hypothetical protein